jgi:hypothetical protein
MGSKHIRRWWGWAVGRHACMDLECISTYYRCLVGRWSLLFSCWWQLCCIWEMARGKVYKMRGWIPLELDRNARPRYSHFQNRESSTQEKLWKQFARSTLPNVRNAIMFKGTLAINSWIHSEGVTSTVSPGSLPDSRFPALSRTNLLPRDTLGLFPKSPREYDSRGDDLVGRIQISRLSPQSILE